MMEKLCQESSHAGVWRLSIIKLFVVLGFECRIYVFKHFDILLFSLFPVYRKRTILCQIVAVIELRLLLNHVVDDSHNLFLKFSSHSCKAHHLSENCLSSVNRDWIAIRIFLPPIHCRIQGVSLKEFVISVHMCAVELARPVYILIIIPRSSAFTCLVSVEIIGWSFHVVLMSFERRFTHFDRLSLSLFLVPVVSEFPTLT